MRRILVTGGAGFIGSAIVGALTSRGDDVYVLDNLSFGARKFISRVDDNHFFEADLLDVEKVRQCVELANPEVVIHLAAIHFIPYCNSHPFLSTNINIQGSINLLNCCEKLPGLKKIFFASTAAVYPIMDGPISEDVAPSASDLYGISKIAGETVFREFFHRTKVATIICRFFNAFGPNETNPHVIPAIQEQILKGERKLMLGNLEPRRDYIHTSDMAAAVTALIDKFQTGLDVFNLGTGIGYSVSQIVKAFEEELGERLEVEQDPLRIRKVDRMNLIADIRKISSFLSWTPKVSLNKGIKTLIYQNEVV